MEILSEKIYSILNRIAVDLGATGIEFKVERPKDMLHGDFASNVALSVSSSKYKVLGIKTPLELAEKIIDILNAKYLIHDTNFDRVEIVEPGFINFYLSREYLANQVQKIIKEGNNYGSSELNKDKKASVEFVSANPTGPLHIGNARGGPLGDSIANVLSKVGYKVIREYLHNDVGVQVRRLGEAIYYSLYPEKKPADYEIQYQGSYVKELAGEIEKSLQKDLQKEEFVKKAGEIAVSLLLREILKDSEDMGIKFDILTKESELRKEIPQVIEKLQKSVKEKEGALWFAPASNAVSPDEFLKDRETVIRKSDGEYTYFASDIAYHNDKMSDYDIVIDIWGANHSGHVPRIQAVVKALGFDTNNLKLVLYQYVRLKRGEEVLKMSKRAGNFVTAREVLDEVGKDAFRFFLLMQNASTHMDFDLDLAKKKASDNPVFYVQYAYTRISSIFEKYKIQNTKYEIQETTDLALLKEKEEVWLMRKLTAFPDLVLEVSKTFAINNLATYVIDLASQFHKFYEKQQVISKDNNLTQARLTLLKATQITLKNTLDLLGVSAPEKM